MDNNVLQQWRKYFTKRLGAILLRCRKSDILFEWHLRTMAVKIRNYPLFFSLRSKHSSRL